MPFDVVFHGAEGCIAMQQIAVPEEPVFRRPYAFCI